MLPDALRPVVERVQRGETDAEIGRALHISPRTVRDRLASIMRAIGASDERPRRAILRHFARDTSEMT